MSRLLVIAPLIVLALDVFAIVDLILIEQRRVRAMPKVVWVIVIVLLPIIGAVLWFFLGRESATGGSGQRRTVAPDDDPSFLRNIRRDEEQDERIRRLEQELADLDDDPPKD
ncbi:PLDc N-terminal domain-containing protein [Salinibacterium sp. G-O1]|uniref:PLDc N-terminal domain-containing protein n=1 Tax=Salinibacterium sp. G-O1 TaxID=3046208 RepID=UPI0024BB014B|nr:PLDc N-terminal domain-containing protein [Salinibacterium sp. G-O1]MDJ0336370.1 PLDc N-terminal domain-containing protein [Salinibacterium sp. G-O1]